MPLNLRIPHHQSLDCDDPKTAPDTYPKGRRCRVPGCITILHRYHDGDRCYVHEGPRGLSGAANSRDQRDCRDDLADLMAEVSLG